MPKITLRLDREDIGRAIREVNSYASELEEKAKRLSARLSGELAELSEVGFNGALYDYVLNEGATVPDVNVSVDIRDDVYVVIALGKEAVFAEFGAGVYFNGPAGTSPHPWGPSNLFYIGTYGKGYGARKVWGYYDDGGNFKLTHGTPASKPMYYADQEVRSRIVEIAREVFKDGDIG